MNVHVDHASRVADLEAFAGVSQTGAMTVADGQNATLTSQDRVFGAQKVAVHRDEAKVLQKIAALGAAAGDDWFYRFPVKNRAKGTTDYIEGCSIKLANDLARIYGNCSVDTRVIDLGSSWLIYARFNDYESGFEMTRPFQQQKGGSKMGGADDARRLDIAFQIGVSKAIRNVVVNALQTYADYAFNAARNSLVERIGKNLVPYRERTLQGIENQGIELVRVELVVGKPSKDWTAPDVARVIALMKGIADGMSTIDETFPPKEGDKVDNSTGEVLGKFADDTAAKTTEQEQPAADPQQATASQSATSAPSPAAATEGAEPGNGYASSASSAPSTSDNQSGPTTDAEYAAFAQAWIAEQTEPDECRSRWTREKGIRNKANVTPETRDALEGTVKAKVNELKKK